MSKWTTLLVDRRKRMLIAGGVIVSFIVTAFSQAVTEEKPENVSEPIDDLGLATTSTAEPLITTLSPVPDPTKTANVTGPIRWRTKTVRVRVPGPVRVIRVRVPGPIRYRTIIKYVSRAISTARRPTAPQGTAKQRLVAFGRLLQSRGYRVGENLAFGPVSPTAHAPNSWHYRDGAIDANYDGHSMSETAAIDELLRSGLPRTYGLRSIWRYPGHYDHVHFDIGDGPDLGQRV